MRRIVAGAALQASAAGLGALALLLAASVSVALVAALLASVGLAAGVGRVTRSGHPRDNVRAAAAVCLGTLVGVVLLSCLLAVAPPGPDDTPDEGPREARSPWWPDDAGLLLLLVAQLAALAPAAAVAAATSRRAVER